MEYRDSVASEIRDLTSKMIEVGLCEQLNYPSLKTHSSSDGAVDEISISGMGEASYALRSQPYSETYRVLREKRAFNMLLIDGAMLQFRYRFRNDELVKHVLSFFPSPDLLEYQNSPEIYETEVLFAEVISKDSVTTPIRFDFDVAAAHDLVHPASHSTIGQYQNCRIPVISALTPFRFLKFILVAFYNTPYQKFCSDWERATPDFEVSITERERSELHWSFV